MDTATLTESRKLDREIAAALGWHVRPAANPREYPWGANSEDVVELDVFDEKGELVHSAWYPDPDDLDYVLQHMQQSGIEKLPQWSTDANAALGLWDTIPDNYTPRLVRMVYPRNGEIGYIFKGNIMENCGALDIQEEADTPAEAISRAFMAWKQARGE